MKTAEQVKSDIVAKAGSDEDFRSRLLADPRSAASELAGVAIPEGLEVSVHEESTSSYHLVLPPTSQLNTEQLDSVAGGAPGKWW